MTDLEKLEATEKIIDRSFIKFKNSPLTVESNSTSLYTKLWELIDGLIDDGLIQDSKKLIEIRATIKTNNQPKNNN